MSADAMGETEMTDFVPDVTRLNLKPLPETMEAVQKMADEACRNRSDMTSATVLAGLEYVYACDVEVEPHQDLEGAVPGLLVYGLVLRSDGHRLHSDRLDERGMTDGLELKAGDFYRLDPYDRHWTTVPRGADRAQLIFCIDSDHPDDRSNLDIAEDILAALECDYDMHRMGERRAV